LPYLGMHPRALSLVRYVLTTASFYA
jgi:hypothetical protein